MTKKPIHLFSDFRDGHGKGAPFRYSVYMIHDKHNEKAYIAVREKLLRELPELWHELERVIPSLGTVYDEALDR